MELELELSIGLGWALGHDIYCLLLSCSLKNIKYPSILRCLARFGSDFHVTKGGVHVGKIYLQDDINYSAQGPDLIEIKISLLHLNQKLQKCKRYHEKTEWAGMSSHF